MEDSINIYNAKTREIEKLPRVVKTEEQWRQLLTDEQFRIMRLQGTERPFEKTCSLPVEGKVGIFECAGCGTAIFQADSKFESGTGWPSFWEPVSQLNIALKADDSLGRQRVEVRCARCDSHLGHVFDDGPPPTGKRYCINSVALKLTEVDEPALTETATFAAGCFWGVEAAFRQLMDKGVISTRVGYTGGHTENPTYREVCSGTTGHAEAVEIVFDPRKIAYTNLLDVLWSIHDPTTSNRQGPDVGSQYRSAIFNHSEEQRSAAEDSLKALQESGRFTGNIVTKIRLATMFYPAEEYHQQYSEKRGITSCHVSFG